MLLGHRRSSFWFVCKLLYVRTGCVCLHLFVCKSVCLLELFLFFGSFFCLLVLWVLFICLFVWFVCIACSGCLLWLSGWVDDGDVSRDP